MAKREIDGRVLAKHIDEWLASEEGQKCADGTVSGQYLRNRLWSAYWAGYTAGWSDREESDDGD